MSVHIIIIIETLMCRVMRYTSFDFHSMFENDRYGDEERRKIILQCQQCLYLI